MPNSEGNRVSAFNELLKNKDLHKEFAFLREKPRGKAWLGHLGFRLFGFLLFIDRAVFIFPIIAIYYLGIDIISALSAVIIGVIFLIAFIFLTPQRISISMAIEYWLREGRKNG